MHNLLQRRRNAHKRLVVTLMQLLHCIQTIFHNGKCITGDIITGYTESMRSVGSGLLRLQSQVMLDAHLCKCKELGSCLKFICQEEGDTGVP